MKRLLTCLLLAAALVTNACALEVPTDTTVQNLNGSQQLIKTYTLPPDTDPQTLIEDPFEQEGWRYTFADIVKEENQVSNRKYHTETVTLETDTKNLGKILEQLAATLDYDDGTYSGKSYHKVATGYITSADYVGEITRSDVESVTYKVTYLGTESENSGLVIDRASINVAGLPGKVLPYALALLALAPSAHAAADYSFQTDAPQDYYKSTSYEDVHGSSYNYGGRNVVDYQIPELEYGVQSTTMTGVMERTILPGLQQTVATGGGGYGVSGGGPITVLVEAGSTGSTVTPPTPTVPTTHTVQQPAYTSADGMAYKDGSIGTIKIPSLKINMKVWEGETNTSMSKGLGHYSSTSAWEGNVGACGHNRGTKYAIGSIKSLKQGDTITYTTIYGTRTYAVEAVKIISNTDWSYLQATSDNRITITTCLADHPESRVMVQAVEIRS